MEQMNFPGTISVEQAAERTKRWRETYPDCAKAFSFSLTEMNNLTKTLSSGKFPVINIQAVRFYLGLTQEGVPCLMMVGVAGDYDPERQEGGVDILEVGPSTSLESAVYDFSCPCPYTCATGPVPNPLLEG